MPSRGLMTDKFGCFRGSVWVLWQSLNGRLTGGASVLLSILSLCLTQCEWARGILIVTSSLNNPQQLLPSGWVCVCVYALMCIHESECNSQVSSSTNVWGMQMHHITMATHRKQEVGGRFSAAIHLSSCPFSRRQLPVSVLPSPAPHSSSLKTRLSRTR